MPKPTPRPDQASDPSMTLSDDGKTMRPLTEDEIAGQNSKADSDDSKGKKKKSKLQTLYPNSDHKEGWEWEESKKGKAKDDERRANKPKDSTKAINP